MEDSKLKKWMVKKIIDRVSYAVIFTAIVLICLFLSYHYFTVSKLKERVDILEEILNSEVEVDDDEIENMIRSLLEDYNITKK